ncbi:Stk1 family PASTA domain-containing Ser/Thr kinase [Pseudoclavibacter chungangensis]|uniref:non-specific serine/threonine protein kinase n=2 Tax=Pseudoclavibacter chungangensis TaxID=587635 RepID=A0A7J5BZY8_9MICO|nr:Stk1 family PASTA domain-containing Ser/Thr kinase [Pseudoclavibacter chungangensis]KAB1660096.1 Stk1 family PASTA domain-containing Ser/Thr kinase [Pseudoclavibacter chungangensis]NYJ66801.1 serine/threonine-protein kinase [Pseudoclavibacter chungangensis]
MSPANPDDMIGRLIDGRYQVRSMIARGGMATVYVATDLRLERRVAIKIMHDHLAADDSFRARFIREARAAAKLQHPNVVNVYDQGDDHTFAYMVMEYIPGITLRDLLHDHHRLTAEQTTDVMDAVLSGLQAAHRIGIVHRDLKPENVLLADDGRIKLSDFGLARAASANTASGQVLLGTIAYLSPELVTKGTADIRSDIYSLGIMMYEMLTGEQPYRGDQPVNIAYRHANEDVPPPSDVCADVPPELDDIVAWATERDPENRPADAGALLAALRQAESDMNGGGQRATQVVPTAGIAHSDEWDDGEPTDPTALAVAIPPGSLDRAPAYAQDEAPTTVAPLVRTGTLVADEPDLDALPATGELASQAPRRRRRGIAIAIVVALVTVLAAGTGWWFFTGPGSYAALPEVVGQQQSDAEQAIVDAGFVVGNVTASPSLEVPEGQVMEMDPSAGQRVAPETPVNLTVSSGPEILPVPDDIVGLTEAQAKFSIEQARFTYDPATTIKEFSDQPVGTVLAATDAAGGPLPDEMPEQQPIRLVVSAGAIPNVTGVTTQDATSKLNAVGLNATVASEQFSSTVPAGVVLEQQTTTDPVRPGDTINLVVSKGKDLVEVPNVVGKSASEAKAALEAAGFAVTMSQVPSGTVMPGNVLNSLRIKTTNPAAGTQAERGSTVDIKW